MATEAVCVDAYYRACAPTLHYVTSADDVTHCYSRRPAIDRRCQWTSCHEDSVNVPRQRQTAATLNSLSGTMNAARPRKLSVDDGRSGRAVAGARLAAPAGVTARQRRHLATDDVTDDWCWISGRRRSSGAWSPASQQTIDVMNVFYVFYSGLFSFLAFFCIFFRRFFVV